MKKMKQKSNKQNKTNIYKLIHTNSVMVTKEKEDWGRANGSRGDGRKLDIGW